MNTWWQTVKTFQWWSHATLTALLNWLGKLLITTRMDLGFFLVEVDVKTVVDGATDDIVGLFEVTGAASGATATGATSGATSDISIEIGDLKILNKQLK
jgi:hypothetical protein